MYLDFMCAVQAAAKRNAFPFGVAKLTRLALAGVDLGPIAAQLQAIVERDPDHAGALMDLSVIDQLNGNLEIGLKRQTMALRKERVFHSTCCGARPRLRALAYVTPGPIGANTPLEFLLEGSNIALASVYVTPHCPPPLELPGHDIAFVAAPGSDEDALYVLDEALAHSPAPVVNAASKILTLADDLALGLRSRPGLVVPRALRLWRHELSGASRPLAQFLETWGFPFVIKPFNSRAADGPAKIDNLEAIAGYLAARPEPRFCISPFVDFRSVDGQYRKYRIVFVDGRPYACHMAVADKWNTRYFDANMEQSAAKRADEADFFATFEAGFCRRHQAALAALAESAGLGYFGVDCGETPEGDLAVFKADPALLVHDMDCAETFPYKPAQMRKIFDAFAVSLCRKGCAKRRSRFCPFADAAETAPDSNAIAICLSKCKLSRAR